MGGLSQRLDAASRFPDLDVPVNLEAEACTIGAMLLDNNVIDDVLAIVGPDDFFREAYRALCEAIIRLRSGGRPVDPMLLLEHARGLPGDPGHRDGWVGVVHEVLEFTPHAANAEYHAKLVRAKSVSRQLMQAGQRIIEDGRSHSFTADELIDRAQSAVFAVGESRTAGTTADLNEALDDAELAAERRRNGEVIGVATGLNDLDDLTGCLDPGSLTVIGARPSMGKSAMVLGICHHAAEQGKVPFLVSLEMGRVEVANRLLQSRAGIDSHRIKSPWLMSARERERITEASLALRRISFPIDDTPSRTIAQICANARRLRAKRGIALVVVDYLQLVQGEGQNREQQIADVSRRLKGVARELHIPVVALSQLNRGVEHREDRRPRMSDIRESGAIEQDADLIILLHRPEYYDPNDQPGIAEFIVTKNRHGATSTVPAVFVKQFARFDNLAPAQAEPLPQSFDVYDDRAF